MPLNEYEIGIIRKICYMGANPKEYTNEIEELSTISTDGLDTGFFVDVQ